MRTWQWWGRWGGLVKLAFIGLALSWLVWTLNQRPELSLVKSSPERLIGALAVSQAAFALMAMRWLLTMRAVKVRFTYAASWAVTAQSYFYYHVTPLAVGADMARFGKALSLTPEAQRLHVISGVLIDRVLGFLALGVVFLATLPLAYGPEIVWNHTKDHWIAVLSSGVLASAIVVAFVVVASKKNLLRKEHIETLWQGRSWFTASAACALIMQILYGLALWIGALAFNIPLTATQSVYAASGALFFNLIPASLFGIGAAQIVGGVIYLSLGLSETEAIFMVALGYVLHLAMGLLGAIAEIAGLDRRWSKSGATD